MIRPEVVRSMVEIRFSSVDFPEPEAPITPIKLPSGTEKLTSSTARVFRPSAEYSFFTWFNSSIFFKEVSSFHMRADAGAIYCDSYILTFISKEVMIYFA